MKQQQPQITTSLDPLDGKTLASEQTYDSVTLQNHDANGIMAADVSFNEAALEKVQFVGAKLEKFGLMDARLRGCDLSGSNCSEGSFIRTELSDSRLTGIDLSRATLKDVTFRGCKLDTANFRFATLTRVRFVDCQLTDTDFMAAELHEVAFESCILDRTAFDQCKVKGLDLRTSQLIDVRGWRDLRGVSIDSTQLVAVAPQLAAALELQIKD